MEIKITTRSFDDLCKIIFFRVRVLKREREGESEIIVNEQ